MKNWQHIAQAMNLPIPAEQIEKIGPALDGLEAAFGPLRSTIPHELEPAIIFKPQMEDAE